MLRMSLPHSASAAAPSSIMYGWVTKMSGISSNSDIIRVSARAMRSALGAPTADRMARAETRMMSLFEEIPDIFVTHPYMIEEGAAALAECGSDILNMVSTSQ